MPVATRSQSRLSIGLPVHNGENHLAESIESLLAQTFEDFELILSDNASTDSTPDICQDFAHRDKRIRYFRQRFNIGASRNFNWVVHRARAPFFKWAAHDDIYEPTFFERCMDVLQHEPKVILAHSMVDLIDTSGAKLCFDSAAHRYIDFAGRALPESEPLNIGESDHPVKRFDEVLQRVNWCFAIFGIIRSHILRQTSLQESYFGCDKVLLAQLALLGPFRQVRETLFHYRFHSRTSRLLSWRERQRFVDPNVSVLIPAFHTFKGYLQAPRVTASPPLHQIRCAGSVMRMFLRPGLASRIFRPGPHYYLGVDRLPH